MSQKSLNGLAAKLSNLKTTAVSAARSFRRPPSEERDTNSQTEEQASSILDPLGVLTESTPKASAAAGGGIKGIINGGSLRNSPVFSGGRFSPRPGSSGSGRSGSSAMSLHERVTRFTEVLAAEHIDEARLRTLAKDGIPDKDGLRALTWKILLGYLPADTTKWMSHLMKKRAEYRNFREELIVKPGAEASGQVEVDEGHLASVDVTEEDHPLSQGTTSAWNTYFKDAEVMEQIERDVMRTHPDMHFFSGDKSDAVRHREEMQRALFVYAKLNPGLTYVQGMNELLAPLYYTFSTDVDEDACEHAEADAFWCFIELMTEFRDNYCKQLDNSDQGIKAAMAKLTRLLKKWDPELQQHLELRTKVDPQFYAFRWITLLLTQEHSFPDTVRLWDTILSFPHGRADFLIKVCVAMMVLVREDLLEGDFSHNIKLLQRYPRTMDIGIVIHTAMTLNS